MRAPSNPRIRVLHVIASSAFGGAERMVATVLRMLDRDRFEVCVACHGQGPMLEEYRRAADNVWQIDFPTVFSAQGLAGLTRLMRRLRVQVVHTHLWSADVLGGLAARLAGVPARVATVHGGYFQLVDERGVGAARKKCLSRVYRSTYGLFDRVIAVSAELAADLSSRPGLKVAPGKIVVIHYGLELSGIPAAAAIDARPTLGLPERGPVVTTVANFVPMKGHHFLVAAMPRVLERWPTATFVLVGHGRDLGAVRSQVTAAGLDSHVRFLGARPDAVGILAASDVVVLPSVAAEGLPVTIMEALALGRPVVATRVGGVPEIIEPGRSGLLVPRRDPAALADGINAVLSDPASAARMGDCGRAVVAERFSPAAMIGKIERIYEELVAGAARGV